MSCGWHTTAMDALRACADCPDSVFAAQVLGIDVLMGCKGTSKRVCAVFACLCVLCVFAPLTLPYTEPEKQFALVERHIRRLREVRELVLSEVIIMVERNLGFEAEHHERALNGLPYVRFRVDHAARRFGILTTEEVKYGMMTLFNNMLRAQRVAFREPLLSEDPPAARRRIQEQMKVYSFQFKQAANCFSKQRVALCGKVGGMKDDVVIALQLAVYYSERPDMYA